MLDLEKLRKAPRPIKERFTAVITIGIVGIITIIWFVFTVSSFFKQSSGQPALTASSSSASVGAIASVTPPFSN